MAWKQDIFNNFIKLNRGFDLPEKDIISGDFPVVASTSIKAYHHNSKVESPCVVTGRSGSLGAVQYIASRCWPLNTTLYVKDYKGNLPRYVYYFLETMHLENFNSGAGVPTLNQNHLHKLKINIPSLQIQRKIAAVLSTYDDLIENNNHRIAILEKMAEELYREWFVRIHFPGHEKVKIVKGVPEGWEVKKIEKLINYQIGGGWGQDSPQGNENVPVYVIRGTDFKDIEKGDFSRVPLRYEKPSSVESRKLEHGDLVLENSVNAQSRCTGNTLLITEHILSQFEYPVIPASFCKLVRFKDVKVAHYVWQNLKLFYAQGSMEYFQNVATNGIANFQMMRFLERYELLIPTEVSLSYSFWNYDTSLHKAIISNLRISRGRLLSRLMSGKIDVENMDIEFPASMKEELVHA